MINFDIVLMAARVWEKGVLESLCLRRNEHKIIHGSHRFYSVALCFHSFGGLVRGFRGVHIVEALFTLVHV